MLDPQLELIKEELYKEDLLQKKAKFQSYTDFMFGYEIKKHEWIHELCVIDQSRCFFRNEKVIELFRPTITYMTHRIYHKDTHEFIHDMSYVKENFDESQN